MAWRDTGVFKNLFKQPWNESKKLGTCQGCNKVSEIVGKVGVYEYCDYCYPDFSNLTKPPSAYEPPKVYPAASGLTFVAGSGTLPNYYFNFNIPGTSELSLPTHTSPATSYAISPSGPVEVKPVIRNIVRETPKIGE